MMKKQTVPKHLTRESSAWYKKIIDEYGITDTGGLLLLQTACESFDRMKEAQKLIAVEGITILDFRGTPRIHPANAVERDSRSALISAIKTLGLDPGQVGVTK
jgi:P27 family predicted phage terminase small subunit